jgi:hypothetical protein
VIVALKANRDSLQVGIGPLDGLALAQAITEYGGMTKPSAFIAKRVANVLKVKLSPSDRVYRRVLHRADKSCRRAPCPA